ncbi:caspase recruitment domain-containing protein 8-like [Coregonus clupeaformis]|uniref:caspase recruitment domain-containing protein 8-like n=1 Tax=Coregonus clupeaformis TaxID=59861 RepID=UPI001BDFC26A|nr:caspase recruitment domain-containing protein 8-like [Coregonus clupeaformis]
MASGPESGSSSVHSTNISFQNGASVNAPIMTVPSPAASQHTSPSSGHDFLKKHKTVLETRMGNLRPILSALVHLGVLSGEDREEVDIKTTPTKKNEALLTMIIKKGQTAQEQFYQALKKADHLLVEDLEG